MTYQFLQVIIIISNFNYLVNNYIENILNFTAYSYNQRTTSYQTEKIALTTLNPDSKKLILPQKYEKICTKGCFEVCTFSYYINIYPDFQELEAVEFDKNINYDYLFTEEELSELKFENLYKYAKTLNK